MLESLQLHLVIQYNLYKVTHPATAEQKKSNERKK